MTTPQDASKAYASAGTASQKGKSGIAEGRVLVGLSGRMERGDSFLVAALLRNQGYEVLGVHFRVGATGGDWAGFKSECTRQPAVESVTEACKKLDIPLQVVDVRDEFIHSVADFALHETLALRRPRPCVPCNDRVRIPVLMRMAEEMRCSRIATGHHAQNSRDLTGGPARLLRSVNLELDQTYDLFRLDQSQLDKLLLPLGSLSPAMLSKLGKELGLPPREDTRNSGDSTCAVGEPGYLDFVESRSAQSLRSPGLVRASDGSIIGEHQGLFRYQLGQSDGLGNLQTGVQGRVVVDFEPATPSLVIGPREELLTRDLLVSNVSWIRPVDGLRSRRCQVVTRNREAARDCEVVPYESSRVQVHFPKEWSGFLPGQPAVFYEGDEVIGGGFIDRVRKVW